jgi:hypothetical protein
MARPKSQTLFHFTRKLDYLKGILKDGFHPRYCLEDLNWAVPGKSYSYAYPMVCFCEIPLSRVDEHVEMYGKYGIGMSRAWAVRNGLNPILYLSNQSMLYSSIGDLGGVLQKIPEPSKADGTRYVADILRNTKPLTGSMRINGVERNDIDFYQESEWRYLPKHAQIPYALNKSNFETPGTAEDANKLTHQHCLLGFSADDIRYLFVGKDADIPILVDFMRSSESGLGKRFTGDEMKILETRIVSLESLAQDL